MDRKAELKQLESLASWLDDRFRLPGTNLRFGLDSILGLMPGVGDGVTALPSLYLIARARALGMPMHVILRMTWNVLIDMVVGAVPLLGDIFDFAFKANSKNIEILKQHLSQG